ncbi:hypothetical protein HYDPIDRAFT_117345 [Hydnomerulius pinastri MD-312]|uniref:Uncharacterized protein n=1 Tax=Hydnomerulius pinastri MD-312 TaxID=994086 RepID=A0A0C9WAC1_9AGAM|nr:hypothetical protein HYDPIDRAFT_117345 [Hydnomerulius pinastri MD-312]
MVPGTCPRSPATPFPRRASLQDCLVLFSQRVVATPHFLLVSGTNQHCLVHLCRVMYLNKKNFKVHRS